jgi:hypothetical protein
MESEQRLAILAEKRKRLEDLKLRNHKPQAEAPVSAAPSQRPQQYDKGVQTLSLPEAGPTPPRGSVSQPRLSIERAFYDASELTAFLDRASRLIESAFEPAPISARSRPSLLLDAVSSGAPPLPAEGAAARLEVSQWLGLARVWDWILIRCILGDFSMLQCELKCEETAGRPLSGIDWSNVNTELVLGCYRPAPTSSPLTMRSSSAARCDGPSVVLWNASVPLVSAMQPQRMPLTRHMRTLSSAPPSILP